MNAGAIVLCRMDSSRLPGKTFLEIGGATLLGIVVERCLRVESIQRRVVVATTDRSIDEPVVDFCSEQGLAIFRGACDDVAGRMLAAAKQFDLDWFFRVNGDSPFLTPALLDEACELAASESIDFVTNLMPRSFPYGVAVELIRTKKYDEWIATTEDTQDHEDVTRCIYRHLDEIPYRNLAHPGDNLSDVRLTVDTPEDVPFFEKLCSVTNNSLADLSFEQAADFYRAWNPTS